MSTDRFTLDILREGFLAVADEMFISLQRTSQSPIVYEVLDFGVGLTDSRGELVSQGNGVAGFLGPLGDVVTASLELMSNLIAGDVVVANDPYAGGGTHLSDVAMVRPVFVDGELVAFAAAKAHWTDVGGRDPGSWSSSTTSVFQEGLQMPFIRAWQGGQLNDDIVRIITANSRLPSQALGDLMAQAACLEVADRRVQELCSRYGTDTVKQAMREVLDRSERLAQAALANLPRGTFEATDFADKDGIGNGPFEVRVRVDVGPNGMHCDFTGSHPQVPGPINCTWSGLVSGVRTVFKAITDPNEPATDGWFRPLEITCPSGTIFTAQRPAPVAAYFESSEIASDLVWKALAAACPDRLSSGHFLSVCATSLASIHPDTGEDALLVEPHAGGWGASHDRDGQSGLVSVGDGETYVIPVEVAEQRYGIRVEHFGFNIQPGPGAGRHRGGYGLVREYRILSDEAIFTVAMGRHDALPWGVDNAQSGSPNYVEIVSADGTTSDRFGKATAVRLKRGDLIRIVTGTGGGWGSPAERPHELIREDLRGEYVSLEAAHSIYAYIPGSRD